MKSAKAVPAPPGRQPRVVGRGVYANRRLRYSLRMLREAVGMTQVEVAEAADMTQADVSQLEARSDSRRSTLERYARALGGKLHVEIEVGGRRYVLDQTREASDVGS